MKIRVIVIIIYYTIRHGVYRNLVYLSHDKKYNNYSINDWISFLLLESVVVSIFAIQKSQKVTGESMSR